MRIDGYRSPIPDLGTALIVRDTRPKADDRTLDQAEQALRDFARGLARLRDSVGALDGAAATKTVASRILRSIDVTFEVPGFAKTQSSDRLGLSLADKATSLRSSQEVNAITTSYGPFAPVFGVRVAPGSLAAPSETVSGTERRPGAGPAEVRFRLPDRLQREFETFGKQLEETLAGIESRASVGADSRERFGVLLRRAFGVFDSKTLEFGGFGITVDLRPGSERLLTVDGQALGKAAVDLSADLHEFLRRPDSVSGRRGFFRELDELLDEMLADLARRSDAAAGGRGLIDRSG